MNKKEMSVMVIGFQKEDNRMYPHLYDFLQDLRDRYDDVAYINGGDQGEGLHFIDRNIKEIVTAIKNRKVRCFFHKFYKLLLSFFSYVWKQIRLRCSIKNRKLKYDKKMVLAIDHTSVYVAQKYFPGKVLFWSYDILTKDYAVRIKNGFLEKLITSKGALSVKTLIIQDEQRKKILEESIGSTFTDVIYLPVGLNDLRFCKDAAEHRKEKKTFSNINIVQSGYITEGRWSDKLIDSYQHWPSSYNLYLRGFIKVDIKNKILNVKKRPFISEDVCANDILPEILNNYDIGFVGYAEKDSNHRYIENTSVQLVEFLRLGIPVIGCGSSSFNDFLTNQNVGIGISYMEKMEEAVQKIVSGYAFFSSNARKLYEVRFNLVNIFDSYLIEKFEMLC